MTKNRKEATSIANKDTLIAAAMALLFARVPCRSHVDCLLVPALWTRTSPATFGISNISEVRGGSAGSVPLPVSQ
jgi:hypothetical protein